MRELHAEWYDHKVRRIKQSSMSTYEWIYSTHLDPYFGPKDMTHGVSNKELNMFVEHLVFEKKVSVRMARDIRSLLHGILKFGSIQHDIPLYTYSVDYPSQSIGKSRSIKFFSTEQCKKIFDEMEKNPTPETLGVVIGLTTGMRIGELCGLKFSDVDFEEKHLSVNRTIVRVALAPGQRELAKGAQETLHVSASGRSAIIANTPKTFSSRRSCPIPSFVLKWIKLYSKTNTPDRYLISLKEMPVDPNVFRDRYAALLKRLGIPYLNPHCMRHTFATQMLHGGVDPATTAEVLGHSSPAITLEVYSHTNDEKKRRSVNAVFGRMAK